MRSGGFNTPWFSRVSQGGSHASPPYERKEPSDDQLMKGLGSEVETIPVPFDAGRSSPISIQGFEAIASYSWVKSPTPTIVVPGSPPVWRGRAMPYIVAHDTGIGIIDHNAARFSSSPLLPLLAVVTHYAPRFSLGSVDVVTDRNGLRKLCRWASGDPKAETFRIDVALAGSHTVLMQRWEPKNMDFGGPGYEREFERASTTPGVRGKTATAHHRIVTYDIGGLKMLVRFKCDACLSKNASSGFGRQKVTPDPPDELKAGLQKLTVASSSKTATTKTLTFKGASLSLHTQGTLVSQSDIVELKTRSIHRVDQFDWDDTYFQLLLSQTPNIFVCVHRRGVFTEVRARKLAELETEETARKAQETLRKLRKVLAEIQVMMVEEGEGAKLSLICKPGDEMVVYEKEREETRLPEEVLKKFEK